jgi:hypothetical protein
MHTSIPGMILSFPHGKETYHIRLSSITGIIDKEIFECWSQTISKNKKEIHAKLSQCEVARGTKSKCEKCGQIINADVED